MLDSDSKCPKCEIDDSNPYCDCLPYNQPKEEKIGMINPNDPCGNMTIKTFIAAEALKALLSNSSIYFPETTPESFAQDAILYANALIDELNAQSNEQESKNDKP